jgi:hypothetical protein
MDERDNSVTALDIIGDSRDVIAFLRDVASMCSMQDQLTPDGFEGLSRILRQVNEDLIQASNLLEAR